MVLTTPVSALPLFVPERPNSPPSYALQHLETAVLERVPCVPVSNLYPPVFDSDLPSSSCACSHDESPPPPESDSLRE